MDIEIWSDLVCPWCYIGKRRFENALADFEHRDDIRVVWHSFEIDAESSSAGDETLVEQLTRVSGGREEAERQVALLNEQAAETGLAYALDTARPVNSRNAHRLVHLARATDPRQDSVVIERLMRAFTCEGRSLADTDTLVELGVEVGVDAAAVREMLAGDAYDAEVIADRKQARERGITAVPAFVFGPYGISGAQPPDVFAAMMKAMHFIG